MVIEGETRYMPLAAYPSGTYEARRSAIAKGPPEKPTVRDALSVYSSLTVKSRDRGDSWVVRGAPAIVERLRAKGHDLRVSDDGESLGVLTKSPSTDLRHLVISPCDGCATSPGT